MPLQKKKKKVVRMSRRTGVNAAPLDKGFESVQYYFQTEISRKDATEQMRTYVKSTYSKADAAAILAHPDSKYMSSYYSAATAFWYSLGQPTDEKTEYWKQALDKRLADLVAPGKIILQEKKAIAKTAAKVVTLSPQQRLQNKIGNTIMQDLLDLEDQWIEGEKASIDVYALFTKYGLGGSATLPVREVIEGWLLDYEDAYHKRCEQAVEGYSHLKRPELNRRINECNAMLADLERVKSATKAKRKISSIKTPSLDKQIAKVKWRKDDKDFKIVSINPAAIIGKNTLYVFNVKYKKLSVYYTQAGAGFVIKGTTIQNYDKTSSITWALRKPLDVLPKVISSTPKQVEKLLKELTTKPSKPTGRLNEETVLLRAD